MGSECTGDFCCEVTSDVANKLPLHLNANSIGVVGIDGVPSQHHIDRDWISSQAGGAGHSHQGPSAAAASCVVIQVVVMVAFETVIMATRWPQSTRAPMPNRRGRSPGRPPRPARRPQVSGATPGGG
jgi:hypothetical protein